MKLLGYEWLKLFQKRVIWIIVPLLLLANGWMYFQQQMDNHSAVIKHKATFAAYEASYRELPAQQAYDLAIRERQRLEVYSTLLVADEFADDEFFQLQMEELESAHPELIAQFSDSVYADNEPLLRLHFQFVAIIIEQLEAIIAYPDYVGQIAERADKMLSYSIFNEEGSFSYRNILKTPEDFEKVLDIPLKLGLDYGIVSSTTYTITDLLVMIVLFMLSMFIFSSERENGQYLFLRTMKRGKLSLFAVKLTALLSLAAITAILFYGSTIALAESMYGFGDWTRHIQSMAAFKYSHLPLTVAEYVGLFIAGKTMSSMVLAALFALAFLAFNHPSKSYLALAVLLTASYMAYRFIHPASYFNLLKYVNVVAMHDIHHLISQYINLNILGFPVSRVEVVLVSMLLLLALLCVCAAYAFIISSEKQTSRQALWRPIRLKRNSIHIRGSSSLPLHEFVKLASSAKGWIIITCALLIAVHDMNSASAHFDWDQSYYNEYMGQLSGELTADKIKFVENEKQRFDQLPVEAQRLYGAYREGELTLEQYNLQKGELEQLQLKRKAFQRVYKQYVYLLELKQTQGIDGQFVNELSSSYLFANRNRDVMNAIMYSLLLVLLLSSSFTIDHRNEMMRLLKTMQCGRLRFFIVRFALSFAAAALMLIILYTPQYVNTFRLYPAMPWDAPLQSIEHYKAIDGAITICQFAIVESLLKLAGCLAAVVVMLLLSQSLKKLFSTMLAGFSLLIGPLLAYMFGFSPISSFSLNYPQLLFILLAESGQQSYAVYYYTGLVLLSGVCLYVAWRLHSEGRLLGQRAALRTNSKEVSS